jgi:hypothetical protein
MNVDMYAFVLGLCDILVTTYYIAQSDKNNDTDELDTAWKEVVVASLRYYHSIWHEMLRKTTRNVSHNGL